MPLLTPFVLGALACMVNFGMLLFNLGFTRASEIAALNPEVFSVFGQAMILVWGVAFLLAGFCDGNRPSHIWWAFTLEKFMYVSSYVLFLKDIPALKFDLSSLEFVAPLFHYIYGPIDFIFMVLFAQQGLAASRVRHDQELKSA